MPCPAANPVLGPPFFPGTAQVVPRGSSQSLNKEQAAPAPQESPLLRAGLGQDALCRQGRTKRGAVIRQRPSLGPVDTDSHTRELLGDVFPRLTLGVISLQLLHTGLVSSLIQAL